MSIRSVIHFGYRFQWPASEDPLQERCIRDALALNDILPEPIFVACLRPIEEDFDTDLYTAIVVLGITIDEDTDLDDIVCQRASLDEFISGHPFMEGFHFDNKPRFYSGFPWDLSTSSSVSESLVEESSMDSELESVSDPSIEEDEDEEEQTDDLKEDS